MTDRLIEDQDEFEELCVHLRGAGLVGFDTEFVSENTFRPELGLLQFATAERCVAVDPYAVQDLESWWKLMAGGETTIVVHGGQAEARFCLDHFGTPAAKLVDVQIAEGLRSLSYPLSFTALLERVLQKKVHGKETRTDWQRRPLSERQVEYALDDVRYLLPAWERQRASLVDLGRLEWAEAEFQRLIDSVQQEADRPSWNRLPGLNKLNHNEFAVAVELADWREEEARQRNRPPRQVLRDDLLIEVARRQPRSFKQLMATRDMNRRNYRRIADELLECVRRGTEQSQTREAPRKPAGRRERHEERMLGQLLGIALSNRCAEVNVARSLIGTSDDLKGLIRWHLQLHDPTQPAGPPPRLAEGWRAEVCGNLLTDLLDGKISLRVEDPRSNHPLLFERTEGE